MNDSRPPRARARLRRRLFRLRELNFAFHQSFSRRDHTKFKEIRGGQKYESRYFTPDLIISLSIPFRFRRIAFYRNDITIDSFI